MCTLLRSKSINYMRMLIYQQNVLKLNITYKNFHTNNLHGHGKHSILSRNSKLSVTAKRTFFSIFRRPTIAKLKLKDEIPENFKLVYRNTMERYILMAQVISTVTATIVCVALVFKHDFKDFKSDFKHLKGDLRTTQEEVVVYATFFILLVVVLQIMVARTPLRIYKVPDVKKYVFVFHGGLPFSKQKILCKVGDLIYLDKSGIIPWKVNQYLLNNERTVILFEQFFHRPADLYIMMGQQKDPDEEED